MIRTRLQHVLKILGIVTILLEINPLTSEPLRLAVLIGTEAATHNVFISTIVFGGVTLLWELVCVVIAADLLDGKISKKIIEHTKNTIGKIGLNRLIHTKTNTLTDFAIMIVLGSPATIILKHSQDPSRSAEKNRHLGYAMSVGAGVIAGLQGAAIVEGLWHPSVITDVIAVIIVGGSLVAYYRIKRYLTIGT